jgi:hypothetical protein
MAVRIRQSRDRATAPALSTSYPTLASLRVGFDFNDGAKFVPSSQVTVFHPPARAYFRFACPYGDCDGEFDLTQAVELMTSGDQLRAGGHLRCVGTRHGGTQCTLCLTYSVAARLG